MAAPGLSPIRPFTGVAPVVLSTGLVWIASDLGYYFGLPALGHGGDYNHDPIAVSLYYLFWCGTAAILFWPVYQSWSQHAQWPTFASRPASLAIWWLLFAAAVGFAGYVMPGLEPTSWPEVWGKAPAIVEAGAGYFLPKSLEILFQQMLAVALVLALASAGLRLARIALVTGLLFGAMHVFLFFGDMPVPGVLRFMVFSALFGAILPWLALRVPNGLAWAYALHWGYYAGTIALLRVFGPRAPLEALAG